MGMSRSWATRLESFLFSGGALPAAFHAWAVCREPCSISGVPILPGAELRLPAVPAAPPAEAPQRPHQPGACPCQTSTLAYHPTKMLMLKYHPTSFQGMFTASASNFPQGGYYIAAPYPGPSSSGVSGSGAYSLNPNMPPRTTTPPTTTPTQGFIYGPYSYPYSGQPGGRVVGPVIALGWSH